MARRLSFPLLVVGMFLLGVVASRVVVGVVLAFAGAWASHALAYFLGLLTGAVLLFLFLAWCLGRAGAYSPGPEGCADLDREDRR